MDPALRALIDGPRADAPRRLQQAAKRAGWDEILQSKSLAGAGEALGQSVRALDPTVLSPLGAVAGAGLGALSGRFGRRRRNPWTSALTGALAGAGAGALPWAGRAALSAWGDDTAGQITPDHASEQGLADATGGSWLSRIANVFQVGKNPIDPATAVTNWPVVVAGRPGDPSLPSRVTDSTSVLAAVPQTAREWTGPGGGIAAGTTLGTGAGLATAGGKEVARAWRHLPNTGAGGLRYDQALAGFEELHQKSPVPRMERNFGILPPEQTMRQHFTAPQRPIPSTHTETDTKTTTTGGKNQGGSSPENKKIITDTVGTVKDPTRPYNRFASHLPGLEGLSWDETGKLPTQRGALNTMTDLVNQEVLARRVQGGMFPRATQHQVIQDILRNSPDSHFKTPELVELARARASRTDAYPGMPHATARASQDLLREVLAEGAAHRNATGRGILSRATRTTGKGLLGGLGAGVLLDLITQLGPQAVYARNNPAPGAQP